MSEVLHMVLVRVYKYLYPVSKIDCPFYKPYSHVDFVCIYNPRDCPNKQTLLGLFSNLDSIMCFPVSKKRLLGEIMKEDDE